MGEKLISDQDNRPSTKWARASEIWLLAGILGLGFVLRVYRLGALGLDANEDYVAIAVRSILENGTAVFPSGVVYPRALPFTYLTAGFASLFGTSEFALRLPSVLFSMISVFVVYLLGRRLVSPGTALLAAFLMAVSDWEIEYGRTARMYSMFSASCLVGIWLLHRAMAKLNRWQGIAAAGLTFLSCMLHQIAIALGVIYAGFLIFFRFDRRRIRVWVPCLLMLVLGFAVNRGLVRKHYDHWNLIAGEANVELLAHVDPDSPPPGFVEKFDSRHLSVFQSFRQAHRGVFVAVTTLTAGFLLGVMLAAFRRPSEYSFFAALALLTVFLYLQQVMLATLVLVAFVLIGRQLQPRTYRQRSLALFLPLVIVGSCWFVFGLSGGASPDIGAGAEVGFLSQVKRTVRPLFYPPNFLRHFGRYAVMSALAALACLVAVIRYLRGGRIDGLGLITLILVPTGIGLGFYPTALDRTFERYVFFLNPYYMILVAFGVVFIAQRIRSALSGRKKLCTAVLCTYGFALLLATGAGNLRTSYLLVSAEYGVNEDSWSRASRANYFQPDIAGSALFVMERHHPTDIVIAMDVLGHYAYFPVADYQLTLFEKRDAEAWIGAQSITSAQALADVLDRHSRENVWIALAGTHLRWFADDPRMDDILRLVRQRGGEPRHRARDGFSDVYLVPGRGPLPGGS